MTQFNQSYNVEINFLINERKLDYLFNKNIKQDDHNSPRALQNMQQMYRLGFYDNWESRQIIKEHLVQSLQQQNNVLRRFINRFTDINTGIQVEIDTELRDSILAGASGKFAQVISSWQVMPDGTRRFLSAILYGK